MKRTATALALAFAAAALLTGASVWEGAAVTAAAGELPDSGYYVATNAFPRNTVVDVKNLENDKTVRAIVSGGLDSPGLLASLSREAAVAIGMTSRDIGRVRMTMPADPIAFARFNEGFEPSGDPDHDPQAAIAAAVAPPADTAPAEIAQEPPAADAAPTDEAAPQVAAAPETEAVAEEETPVDLAEAVEESEAEVAETTSAEELPATEELAAAEDLPAAEAAPEAVVVAPVEEAPAAEVAAVPEPAAEIPAEEAAPAEVAAVPEPAALEPGDETPAEAAAPATEEVATSSVATVPEAEPVVPAPASEVVDIALVPAEDRPPVPAEGAGLPAEAEVAPLAEPTLSEPVPMAAEVAPIEPERASTTSALPNFSVPVIADLEKGKYYLQLGAFGKAEAVEAEIAKHRKSYPLAIQSAGSSEKPVYRVLLGPVNLGESGALLQRFKRIGYKDAFVKQGS